MTAYSQHNRPGFNSRLPPAIPVARRRDLSFRLTQEVLPCPLFLQIPGPGSYRTGRRPARRLNTRTMAASTSKRWIKPPPIPPINPTNQRIRIIANIVQSIARFSSPCFFNSLSFLTKLLRPPLLCGHPIKCNSYA